ncbi:MAG: ABC transporter ATP-binding protein [Actinomycetota bacterium]
MNAATGGIEPTLPTRPADDPPRSATWSIETVELQKRHGDVTALAPLDLRVAAGERVALIGHNGSGKSTLTRLLAGISDPSGGSAIVAGHAVGTAEARAAVSVVPDRPVVYDDLTVWEHLEYVARLHRTDAWEDHAHHLVEVLGLEQRVDDLPATFSRGLAQKTQLALALVRPFEVLVLDEPFTGLDRAGRIALLDLLAWAHGDGATLLVATHDHELVDRSDRVIALLDGQVVHDGAADVERRDEFTGLDQQMSADRPGEHEQRDD